MCALEIKTRQQIEVSDWDKLIEDTYGKIYNFQQQDDCQSRGIVTIRIPDESNDEEMHDSIPFEVNGEEMGVKFKVWLETTPEDTRKHFNQDYQNVLFWKRNFYPDIQTIANDLHAKGLIEKGTYDIKIDW